MRPSPNYGTLGLPNDDIMASVHACLRVSPLAYSVYVVTNLAHFDVQLLVNSSAITHVVPLHAYSDHLQADIAATNLVEPLW